MGRRKPQSDTISQATATPVSDKARLETFAANLLKLETPRISGEIDEQIASVMSGAAEELQWIADELEHGGV